MAEIDVEVLEARARWLEQQLAGTQVELTKARARRAAREKGAAAPQQAPLLEVESTQPEPEKASYAYFRQKRKATLEAVHAFVEDEKLHPAFINTTLKRLFDRCEGDVELVADVIVGYFADSWPAKYTPPYPFRMFASAKTMDDLIAKARVKARTA